jgi:hypothetical protein
LVFRLPAVADLFYMPPWLSVVAGVLAGLLSFVARGTLLARIAIGFLSCFPYLVWVLFVGILLDPRAPDRPLTETYIILILVGALIGALGGAVIATRFPMKPNSTIEPDARSNGARGSS